MRIQFRSLAALSILGLALIACNPISASQPLAIANIDQNQPAQTANGSDEDTKNSTISRPANLDEGHDLKDEGSTSLEIAGWPDDHRRVDQQGAVELEIFPVNLNEPQDTLDFEVSLNTHSVDLSMNLAALASLKTDSGLEVNASGWSGPSGGHHVSGILSFPSFINGEAVLDGVSLLELTIIELDAPERVFIWER